MSQITVQMQVSDAFRELGYSDEELRREVPVLLVLKRFRQGLISSGKAARYSWLVAPGLPRPAWPRRHPAVRPNRTKSWPKNGRRPNGSASAHDDRHRGCDTADLPGCHR